MESNPCTLTWGAGVLFVRLQCLLLCVLFRITLSFSWYTLASGTYQLTSSLPCEGFLSYSVWHWTLLTLKSVLPSKHSWQKVNFSWTREDLKVNDTMCFGCLQASGEINRETNDTNKSEGGYFSQSLNKTDGTSKSKLLGKIHFQQRV